MSRPPLLHAMMGRVGQCTAIAAIIAFSTTSFAAVGPGSLDPEYQPALGAEDGWVFSLAVDEQGGAWLGTTWKVVRLRSDGRRDTTFAPPQANGIVRALAAAPDGRVYAGGEFTEIGGVTAGGLVRLNTNGTVDTTFQVPAPRPEAWVSALAVQSSGDLLVGGWFDSWNNVAVTDLIRLTPAGSVDSAFLALQPPTPLNRTSVARFQVSPSGKVWIERTGRLQDLSVEGSTLREVVPMPAHRAWAAAGEIVWMADQPAPHVVRIRKILADSSIDPAWDREYSCDGDVLSLAVQSDGRLLIGGTFAFFGGSRHQSLVRLNVDGSLDHGFVSEVGVPPVNQGLPPQSDSGVRRIEPSMDGTWTVIGTFTHAAGQPARGVARILGGDRAPAAPVLRDTAPTLTVVEGRRIAFGPFVESSPDISARWTRNGEGLPAAETPALTLEEVRFADAGEYQLSVSNRLGVTTSAPLRLIVESAPTHPGSVDLNFKPEPMVPLSTNPLHQATTANLSLIPAGSHLYVLNRTTGFQGFGSHLTTNVARLLANGAVDPGFVMFRGGPPPAKIEAVLPLRDGRIAALIQNPGAASSLIQRALVAVLADGTADPGFRYDLGEHHRSANPPQIRETPDGGILVAHRAPLGDGGTSVRVLRVGSDGQVDPSFQPVPVVTESVRMAFQSGNRLLIAGGSYQPPVPFARVLPDGTRDPAFHPDPLAQADVSALLVDARDRILVTLAPQPLGAGGQPVLLRLLPDGALDPSFNIITDSQPPRIAAFSVALQADGHLIALRVLNGLPSVPLVRYGPDGHPDPTFQFPMEGALAGFAVTAGDQIVVNGLFEEIDGFPRHGIARLNGHDDHRLEPDMTRSDAVGCRVWTRTGRRYHIEFSPALAPGDWPVVGSLVGDGEPQSVFHPGHRQGFFRLRIERP